MTVGDRLAATAWPKAAWTGSSACPAGKPCPYTKASAKAAGPSATCSCATNAAPVSRRTPTPASPARLGVCDATVGPGATNLLSPLAEAHCSSIPMLAIISDISRAWEHRRVRGNASQAMEQLEMFKPVSKWQVTLSEPASLENVLDQAIRVAVSGRPGPVVVAVPDDVGDLDIDWLRRVRPDASFPRHRSAPDPDQIQAARQPLLGANKARALGGRRGAHLRGPHRKWPPWPASWARRW